MRNHVITVIGRTIQHQIFPLDSKPTSDPPEGPIKIVHMADTKEERIEACLATLKKELEGEV